MDTHFSVNTYRIQQGIPLVVAFSSMEWAERFRLWMDERKLSQEALGAKMAPPVTQGTIGHWLSGRTPITVNKFLELCRVSGADPQTILFGGPKELLTLQRIKEVLDSHPTVDTSPRAPKSGQLDDTIPPKK